MYWSTWAHKLLRRGRKLMNRVAEIGGRVGLLLILVITSLVAGRPWPASAQDNPPIYGPPDDAGALISAINDANIYPGPDTIILEGEGYELTSPDNFMGIGDNGLPRITSEIVIRGDNAVVARWPDAPDLWRGDLQRRRHVKPGRK
jgi:hypothetical protein